MRGNTIIIRELKNQEPNEWCDKDLIMFYVCFQLLEDYVNKEMYSCIDWSDNKELEKEIIELYNWYQERKKVLDPVDFHKQNEIDQEYLKRLIDIRLYLWS